MKKERKGVPERRRFRSCSLRRKFRQKALISPAVENYDSTPSLFVFARTEKQTRERDGDGGPIGIADGRKGGNAGRGSSGSSFSDRKLNFVLVPTCRK